MRACGHRVWSLVDLGLDPAFLPLLPSCCVKLDDEPQLPFCKMGLNAPTSQGLGDMKEPVRHGPHIFLEQFLPRSAPGVFFPCGLQKEFLFPKLW